ncbi:MAG: hypothetical protein LJE70_19890 [Chromatiaceae bacterium]|nr:hypothetical protein [Chromatiaceae bacterium]
MLGESTRAAIEALLIKHDKNRYRRGLFSRDQVAAILDALDDLALWLSEHKPERLRAKEAGFSPHRRFTHQDALCIAYVDHVKAGDEPPAVTLQRFFNSHLAGLYSHLHVLPHFPCPLVHPELSGPASRADGGFEPMSYRMDPKYGDPQDLQAVDAELMFDFVLNHLSTKGDWFNGFIEDDPKYADFFFTIPEQKLAALDLSLVFRPRAHHPVFELKTNTGYTKHVWCTFSASQADINIKNPRVFVKVMEALVRDFVGSGATWIRLDAVGYLVKMLGLEPGEPQTDCFGIEETHNVLKAMNRYLGEVAPAVTMVAEVNATKDVIATYYGNDGDESHMVYEFPVAPLSLFAIYRGDAGPILAWAKERLAHPERIGLAFTASHDGIGVLPMRDVPPLTDGTPALDFLIGELRKRGAGINYKSQVVDGVQVQVPYEACIAWTQAILTPQELEALRKDNLADEQVALIADRIIVSQSFAFTAPHCVPADYLGAIAALLNDEETFEATKHNRNKNRGLVSADVFAKALEVPETNREKLVQALFLRKRRLIEARRRSPAFSPYALCTVDVVATVGSEGGVKPVYSVLRRAPDSGEIVLALTNSSPEPQSVILDFEKLGLSPRFVFQQLLSDCIHSTDEGRLRIEMPPWNLCWLRIR